MAIELDRDNYDSEVLQSREPVLVDFWGPKCQPCLALLPAVEQMEKDYAGKIKVTKVNATENRMLCAKLRVLSLPTFLFYKDGTEINRLIGDNVSKDDITEAINAALA